MFRVVDAVDEYGHFVAAHGFCHPSIRQSDRQSDRFEQMPIAGPLYSVFCATCNMYVNSCQPRKVVGRVPRGRAIGERLVMPGCLLGWARLGQVRVASLGRSWVVLDGLRAVLGRSFMLLRLGSCQ